MAVDAVLSKPLSRPDSLPSEINTGIFRGFCGKCPCITVYPLNPSDFPVFFWIRPRRNREFDSSYQGIAIVYLGKLRPISELQCP
jgi:hypothetical protein